MTGASWVVALILSVGSGADTQVTAGTDVPLFTIAKSENRNVVQYTVRVDKDCNPTPGAPVRAYWRMLERGPGSTEPLLAREAHAYGLSSQMLVPSATPNAPASVRIVLNAMADRPVVIDTFRGGDGACHALSTVRIGGVPAHLFDVYVRLKAPFGVDYLLLQGWSLDGARRVEERIGG